MTLRDGYPPSAEFAEKIHELIGHILTHRVFIGRLQCVCDVRFRAARLFPADKLLASAAIPPFRIRRQPVSPLSHFEPFGSGFKLKNNA